MSGAPDAGGSAEGIRLDKWLWHARFFKSRSLAAAAVRGPMRVNGQPVSKPAQLVRPGDVLTFVQARRVRVVRLIAVGTRRGPASEAQALYEDLEDRADGQAAADAAPRPRRGGRPTGKARRDFERDLNRDFGRDLGGAGDGGTGGTADSGGPRWLE